jgi:cytochrome b561
MLKNSSQRYGLIAKLFHWIIALAVIGLIFVGFSMGSMAPSDEKWQIYAMHKATGVTMLLLITLRFIWRMINTEVLLSDALSSWQKTAAKLAHYALYLCMFLMPISGIMMSRFGGYDIDVFGLFVIPALEKNAELAYAFHTIHEITAFGFSGLIILHICAALYHHFIFKDNTLIKMIK